MSSAIQPFTPGRNFVHLLFRHIAGPNVGDGHALADEVARGTLRQMAVHNPAQAAAIVNAAVGGIPMRVLGESWSHVS